MKTNSFFPPLVFHPCLVDDGEIGAGLLETLTCQGRLGARRGGVNLEGGLAVGRRPRSLLGLGGTLLGFLQPLQGLIQASLTQRQEREKKMRIRKIKGEVEKQTQSKKGSLAKISGRREPCPYLVAG